MLEGLLFSRSKRKNQRRKATNWVGRLASASWRRPSFEPLEDRRLLSLTATWTGAGVNDLWMNAANWGGVAPVAGDNLVFPAGPTQTAAFNNFADGTAFGSIDIAGDSYSLTGHQVLLGGDVTCEGNGNSLGMNLQLSADHGIVNNNTAGATLAVTGAIDLNGHNLSIIATDASGATELDGVISDTAVGGTGGLNTGGNGRSILNAANSYAGATTVNGGTLVVENDQGLGTAATGTDVENGATLELENNITVTGEILTFRRLRRRPQRRQQRLDRRDGRGQ